jgi:hypothetical protein
VKNWILRSVVLLLPAFVLLGCSPDESNAPPSRQVPMPVAHNVLLDGPELVAQAVQGLKKRGEQDEMLKLESSLPGFGGFFFDSTDQLTVYMKPSTGVSTAATQTALANAYANRPEPEIRQRMSGAAAARVIQGDYSLSELIAVENRIAYPSVRLPGFVGVGVSISLNRVKVGFTDAASLTQGVSLTAQMGVPTAVLIPEVWGEPHLTSTFKDKLRPMFGGIQIGIMNRTYVPWDNVLYQWNNEGSIGYDVHTTGGVHYMLTASHLATLFRGINGLVGDTVLQKGHLDYPHNIYPAGLVAINPAWDASGACPIRDSTTMEHFDYCTNADAMLASYLPGVTYTRGVGVSTTEGLHGNAGSQTIREAWQIADVWTPEMVRSGFDGVHKSGSGSGTTTGLLDLPLTQFDANVCMDTWDRAEENMGPHGCLNPKWVRFTNQVRVNTALAWQGDSGGSVFAGNGSPYHALGIVVGSNGVQDPSPVAPGCSGDQCYFWFSKWSEIVARLGQGSLNPITLQ